MLQSTRDVAKHNVCVYIYTLPVTVSTDFLKPLLTVLCHVIVRLKLHSAHMSEISQLMGSLSDLSDHGCLLALWLSSAAAMAFLSCTLYWLDLTLLWIGYAQNQKLQSQDDELLAGYLELNVPVCSIIANAATSGPGTPSSSQPNSPVPSPSPTTPLTEQEDGLSEPVDGAPSSLPWQRESSHASGEGSLPAGDCVWEAESPGGRRVRWIRARKMPSRLPVYMSPYYSFSSYSAMFEA